MSFNRIFIVAIYIQIFGGIYAHTIFNSTTLATRIVNNATQFKDALAAMNPGDTILVQDGNYAIKGVKIARSGTESQPIVIKSANLHGAKITGSSSFTLSAINYVTIEGFDIDIEPMSTIFKMEGCSYVRITRNRMRMKTLSTTQSSKWITVGEVWENANCRSHHNRIDHNLFDGKYDAGAWVIIDGSHGAIPDISKYDRIDHNIFRNNTPRFTNEKETIRVGVSDLSMLAAYCTVDYNLFEDCDGDPEFVSVKSNNNTVSNNTFRRCLGTLSLRHGNNSTVNGNFFFGEGKTALFQGSTIGCGGVRIYGKNHTVTNNYMEGLTGNKWDAACTITNGDVTNTSTSWSSHYLPENLVFAFNTLVDNKSNIEIGFTNNGSYNKAPINCFIANNIVVAKANPLILSYSTTSLNGVSFSNNIMYTTETATLGLTGISDSQIKQIDPQLEKTDCRAYGQACENKTPVSIYKITATSLAINASLGYQNIGTDMEEQPAVGIKDIGADEFNAVDKVKNGPLNESHVGPSAPENYVYEKEVTAIRKQFINENLICSTNPFSGAVRIRLPENAKRAIASFYNTNGSLISKIAIENASEIDFNTNIKGLIYCHITTELSNYALKLISK